MKLSFKTIIVTCIAAAVALLILTSGFFTVTTVEITGLNLLTEQQVKDAMGLNQPGNFFVYSSGKGRKNLLKNNYVQDVEVHKKFPDTIQVKVKERVPGGYVEVKYLKGKYLYIDENGVVMDVLTTPADHLPIVEGLDFKDFTLGKPLPVTNKQSLNKMVELSHLFTKNNLNNTVITVDVSDVKDLHFYLYSMDVRFGDISDADVKMQNLVAILQAMPDVETARGFLDLRDVTKRPYFQYLT